MRSNELLPTINTAVHPTNSLELNSEWANINSGRPLRWLLMATTMFVASLGESGREIELGTSLPLVSPLNELRTHGRTITLVLLIISAIFVLNDSSQCSHSRQISSAAVLFIVSQIVLVVKSLASQMYVYSAYIFAFQSLWFYVFYLGSSKCLRTPSDVTWAIRCVCLAAGLFCLVNLFQARVDPSPLLAGGARGGTRFQGTTANPQFAGVLLALAIPATAFLARNRNLSRWERFSWHGLLLIQFVLMAWTGSRTGMLMTVTGLVLLFRRRFALIGLIVCGLASSGGLALSIFSETVQANDVLRTEDTRSEMWLGLWNGFLASPIFGNPQDPQYGRLGLAENSWLSMACVSGLVGLVPLIGFGCSLLGEAGKLSRLCPAGSRQVSGADVIAVSFLIALIGSNFEAYLLSVVSFPIPYLYLFLAISAALRQEIPPSQ